jgi:pimeloyl-ACP methyl ester carboxylesterase
MAKVILVHGAFNELWGPNELRARWVPALRDGLWHHGLEVDDDAVGVCFYGDLFRADPENDDAQAWEEARAGTAEMLESLGGEGAMKALSQAAGAAVFDRTVDLVTVMASDDTVRERARQRLLDQIGPETAVVVGHSMGSIVSHQALAAHPEIEIDTLVTLGSPLGSDMIAGMLEPPATDGIAPWPGSTRRWVNIAAVGDRAAAVSHLADHFGPRVEDHLVDNGHRAHDPEPYLNAAVTGAAVGRALGLLDD